MSILLYLLFIVLIVWGIDRYFHSRIIKASRAHEPYYIKGESYVILKESDYLDLSGQAIRFDALQATLKREEEQQ